MPFTLVHPAAVVPLARGPLVPSALVAGAVAPDLPYYVPLTWIGGDVNLTLTHAWTSLLWLDPAIALVLLLVLHGLLKHAVLALLPDAAAGRLVGPADGLRWRTPSALGWIVVSAVVGAATHLAWDSLDDALGYNWSTRLDLVSDVVGAAVLLGWGWWWWRSVERRPVPTGRTLPRRSRLVGLVVGASLVLAWVAVGVADTVSTVGAELRAYGGYTRSALLEYVVRGAAVDLVTAVAVLLALWAVAWRVARVR